VGLDISQFLKNNNIQNDRFFVQIQDKITLEIDRLVLPIDNNSSKSEDSQIPNPSDILEYIDIFKLLFKKIEIHQLQIGDISLNLNYSDNGAISIYNDNYYLKGDIQVDNSNLLIHLDKVVANDFNASIYGDILFKSDNNQTLTSIYLNLKNEISGHLYGEVDNFKNVSLLFHSNRIRTLKGLFKTLQLGESAYIWGVERANYEYIQLNAKTNFPIEQPKLALKNLQLNGWIENLKYRFEPKLSPIQAKRVAFLIDNSTLFVTPQKLFYGKNRLNIGVELKNIFSKPHLYAKADGDITVDRVLKNTILYYSKMEQLPVKISSPIELGYFFDMKLYDDLNMKFLANLNIQNRGVKSKELPNIESGKVSFLYPRNLLKLNNVNFSYKNLASGRVSGDVDVQTAKLNLDTVVDRVYIDENTSMATPTLSAKVGGEFNSTIFVDISKSDWRVANMDLNLSNFNLKVDKKSLNLQDLHTNLDEFNLSADINSTFDFNHTFAKIDLGIDRFKFSEINISKEIFSIWIDIDEVVRVEVPKLKTDVRVGKRIDVALEDLHLFSKYLPITKRYPKFGGNFQSSIVDKNISFNGEIDIPQQVIKLNKKRVNNFKFSGLLVDKDLKLSINEKIFIDKSDKIDIFIDDYDFNITGLNDFINMNSTKDEDKEEDKNVSVNIEPEINIYLKNGDIYLTDKNNTFRSKSIYINGKDDRTYIDIRPPDGKIRVETKNDKYIVKGTNLKESLIKGLTAFDGLAGGDYNIYIKGKGGDFNGLLQFRKLKIKHLELLNNILAFINTVPALLTFSRPGFNHNGLRILAGYLEFAKKGDVVYLKEFNIKGENIDFVGKGYINLKTQKISIQIDISAVKYVDKALENIPIANYLILGDDGSISTRIFIKGDIDDPKISTELHKEILSTPIKLTERAFNLPAKVLEIFKKLNINDKENQKNVKEFFQSIFGNK